ncbi:MAG: EamA family transporter [Bacteroidetes bacterium]|nr:EamA family transporter [Bacteroidota bacterium]MBK9415146.1 EamA family transporter [Bacteroidota bacterium]
MNRSVNFNAWLAYAAVAIFWGTTFFAIRVGVETFPPFLMAGFRHSIGGILICLYFYLKGYKLPPKKDLKVFAVNGLLMLAFGNGLVTWAEQYVNSGLAALICSLTPIWIIAVNSVSGQKEKLNYIIGLGILLCLFGQFLLFKDNIKDFADPNYAIGIVSILIANIAWAVGTVYSKNHRSDTNPLFGAGLQMVCGGIILDLVGTARGEWSNLHPSSEAVWALVYLILFGSIIAYGAYMYVLKLLPATIISTYAYINTVVAVFLGWLWLDEPLNMLVWTAVVLTIAGVYLVNKSYSK